MDEELIDYLFASAQREGFKRKREDFVKYVQTDDELFDYLYGKSQREGYKRSKDHFAGLVGRGANQPVQEPVKTEPAKTETIAEQPKVETITETATKEAPMAAKSVSELSVKEVSEPIAEKVDLTDKKNAMAEDMSSKLMPVTEKTQVKEVVEEKKKAEVPTDIKVKEVVKEEPKLKVNSKEIKLEPSEYIESKGLLNDKEGELKNIKLPKYKPEEIIDKKLLTENKSKLGLTQFEDSDYIFKEWLKKEGKPLDKKEIDLSETEKSDWSNYEYRQRGKTMDAIVNSYLPYLIENKDKLSNEYKEKLREELTSPSFKNFVQGFRGVFYNYDKNNPNFKLIEKINEEYWKNPNIYDHVKKEGYGLKDEEKIKMDPNEFLKSSINKDSEKVITKFGPMLYDKNNKTYYKFEGGTLEIEPYINYNKNNSSEYKVNLEVIKPGTKQHEIIEKNNIEKWDGVSRDMYRGIPTDIKVKEVEAPSDKMVIKTEDKKEMPSYDDLGIEKGTNFVANLPYTLPKNIEYEKKSPNELVSYLSDEFGMHNTNVKLNRNVSLRYPDPPGKVFKKQNINGKEVYSSYDENNDKWYTFTEESKNNNWNEVTSSPIKTMLNSKFLIKDDLYNKRNIKDKSIIDIPTEDERNLIERTRRSVYQNIYIPYLLKNEDKLSDDNVEKLQKALENIANPKNIDMLIKEPSFTGTLEEYLKEKERIRNISNTNEITTEYITDKNHLESLNKLIAKTNKPNFYFKPFLENKENESVDFSYNQIENKKQDKELDFYKSILGDVYYDKNNDQFYWTEFNKKAIVEEAFRADMNDREVKYDKNTKFPYFIIKKGTPDYDKIKNSLDKYNK